MLIPTILLSLAVGPLVGGRSVLAELRSLHGVWVLKKFCKSGSDVPVPNEPYFLTFNPKYVTWRPWTPGVLDGTVPLKFTYQIGTANNLRYIKVTKEMQLDERDEDAFDACAYFAYTIKDDELIVTQDGMNADELPARGVTVKGDSLWTMYYVRKVKPR